ncbi:AD domain-containing protein, partial [Pycnococcus provasolii]
MSSASYPLHVPVFLEYSAAAGASDGASGRTVGTLLPSPAPFLIFVSSSSQRPHLNNVRIINTSSASAASLKVTPLTPSEMKQHGVSASMASSVIHGFDPTTMPLPRLDRDKAEARLARNVARIAKMSANFNENVSDEAQSVFDALSRTMECAWEGDRILVRV